MHRFPIHAYTRAKLDEMVNPVSAGQPEALAWVLWDTQTYTDNTTTTLTFFNAVRANPEQGNMDTPGQLPDPQYFQCWGMGLDVLVDLSTTAGGVAGAADDVQQLVMTGPSRALLKLSTKEMVNVPTSFLHTSGGVVGFNAGTWTAEENITWAQNSIPDGGYYVGGAVVIPPKQAFNLQITWQAVRNIAGNRDVRPWLQGVLYRRVL